MGDGAGATILFSTPPSGSNPALLTGPTGYCTEIFYDTQRPDCGLDERWLEIWNIVLMSMLRAPDGSTTPLPRPCVDTGACGNAAHFFVLW
jgi:alanyl-tRNA synthetase